LLQNKKRAGDGIRTRDPNLGKVVLYQLSYSRFQNVSAKLEIFLLTKKKLALFIFSF
jgi:hypothetical protein